MQTTPNSYPDNPASGFAYLRSDSDQVNCTVWVRRDFSRGCDIRITSYSPDQFSIARMSSELYTMEEYCALGHKECKEDEFNNAFIEASAWLLYNTSKMKRRSGRQNKKIA